MIYYGRPSSLFTSLFYFWFVCLGLMTSKVKSYPSLTPWSVTCSHTFLWPDSMEYTPSFNPIALKDSALSTHKPIEVRGPGGKATIVHAQYNTPISMYSQDAIMDAIAGQSQAKGHDRWDETSKLIQFYSFTSFLRALIFHYIQSVYQVIKRRSKTTGRKKCHITTTINLIYLVKNTLTSSHF